jgi:hypothetical protein
MSRLFDAQTPGGMIRPFIVANLSGDKQLKKTPFERTLCFSKQVHITFLVAVLKYDF